jgi:shikimate kinase
VVLDPANVAVMRASGTVVLLDTPVDDIVSRVGDGTRPLVDGPGGQSVAAILEGRRQAYEAAAHFTVDTAGMNPNQVADEVERLCVS